MSCLKSSQNKVSSVIRCISERGRILSKKIMQDFCPSGIEWIVKTAFYMTGGQRKEAGGKKSDVKQTCMSFQKQSKSLHFDVFL